LTNIGAIEAEDQLSINTASDFMAQYTTRQEYRFTEALQDASTVTHHLALGKQCCLFILHNGTDTQ